MDFIINILIALWVVIEAIMFLLEADEAASLADEVNLEFLNDLDNDGTESFDSTEHEREHHGDDSGVVCSRDGRSKPANSEIDKKRRQLLLAKRMARRDEDRKIILAYFGNIKLDGKMESDEAEDGYDSDYDTSQAELVELLVKMAEYIRWHKIVSLYDLSHKFKLNLKETYEQLEQLQMIGVLQGVYDDRDKFAYVAKTELRAVAEFIAEQKLNNWPQLGFI